jgi:hypothetical protein
LLEGVIGSLYKGYLGSNNAAHQCLVGCIGLYAGFPDAKPAAHPAFSETRASRVPRYAGLCPPPSWVRYGHPAVCLCKEQNSRASLGLPPHARTRSHLCQPLTRPPAPLSSLAFAVRGGLRLPLGVRRYPIFCAAVPNPLFSTLVLPLWLFLVRLCRVNCSAILAFCRVVIRREQGTRSGVFVLFGLFAARSRFISRKC